MSAEQGYHGARPLLVDTNVISYVLKRSGLGVEYGSMLSGANVFLSVITLEKLYFGAVKDAWDADRRERLRQLIARCLTPHPAPPPPDAPAH